MSLKLCFALPVALNFLKSTRLFILAPEYAKSRSSFIKQGNLCGIIQQSRWLSTDKNRQNLSKTDGKDKKPHKTVYYGPLSAHIRAVKIFSLSSSIVGLSVQPILYKEILSTGNVPIILAAYSFIGFFTLVTPLLLHLITKKYIMELKYNEETNTYIAKTLNFFCRVKETGFKVEDVFVPDVPGMFETFHVKGKPLFVDPTHFNQPEYYANLMGYDKPMDFKLYEKSTVTNNTTPSTPNK